MRLYNLCSVLAACVLYSAHAHAAFTYQAKPVSPQCLAELLDLYDIDQPSVLLSKCSSIEHSEQVQVQNGVVTTEDKSLVEPKPYANYSVIGEDGNKFLIGLGQWTGGSGFFSSILWVQIKGTMLQQLNVIATGDRCNGGAYKAGPWQYSVNLTAVDLIEFARNKAIKIQPYTDLDASAAGCVAKAYYMFHPDTGTSRLMFVKLNDQTVLSGEWEKQFVTQKCFNSVMSAYISRKEVELDMNGVKRFAQQYAEQCLQNPKIDV